MTLIEKHTLLLNIPDNHVLIPIDPPAGQPSNVQKHGKDIDYYFYELRNKNNEKIKIYRVAEEMSIYPPFNVLRTYLELKLLK